MKASNIFTVYRLPFQIYTRGIHMEFIVTTSTSRERIISRDRSNAVEKSSNCVA